jgi:hypothetical protein
VAGVVSGGLAPNAALNRHEQNSPGFAVNPRCSHGGDVGLGDAGTHCTTRSAAHRQRGFVMYELRAVPAVR